MTGLRHLKPVQTVSLCILPLISPVYPFAGFEFIYLLLLALPETKKSRTSGRQSKEAAQGEESGSPFVVFLRDAGVTLGRAGTANEIGKHCAYFEAAIRISKLVLVGDGGVHVYILVLVLVLQLLTRQFSKKGFSRSCVKAPGTQG